MKFKDLLEKHTWDDILPVLCRLYPDQEDMVGHYQRIFTELSNIQPLDTHCRIVIEEVLDEWEGESYHVVSGKDGTLNKELSEFSGEERANEEVSYGLEFTPWAEWLGMELDPDTAARYPEPEIIAHCLWEMTFYGFTQEAISAQIESLKSPEEGVRLFNLSDLTDWTTESEKDIGQAKEG